MTLKRLLGAVVVVSLAASCDVRGWVNSGTYPLDMRNEYKQYNPESKKMEWVKSQWRMDVPQAYILDTRGRNGVPRNSSSSDFDNDFKMSLSTQVDPETMTLSPNPYKGQSGHMNHRLDIHLSNSRPIAELRKAGGVEHACLTFPEKSELTASSEPAAGRCGATKKLCTLFMYVDGWPIRISIDKGLYNEPQLYCKAALKLLDNMTVHRDDQTATYESIVRDYEIKITKGNK